MGLSLLVDFGADVLYMRFMKAGKVVRVARTSPDGSTIALYPSDKSNFFYGEAFHEIDDVSPKRKVRRSEITDRILLKLLQGEPVKSVLKNYRSFGDDYSIYRGNDLMKRMNSPTFNVSEAEE
jgi:hypothetical protein